MVTYGRIIRYIFTETCRLIIKETIIHAVRIIELFNGKSHSRRSKTVCGVPAVKEIFILGFDFLIIEYYFRVLFPKL